MNLNDMKCISHQQTTFISCWQSPERPPIYTVHSIGFFRAQRTVLVLLVRASEQNQSSVYTENLDPSAVAFGGACYGQLLYI